MKKERILKKAIEKAVKNGFDYMGYLNSRNYAWGINEEHNTTIIFSHDFAKAFWGKGWVCTNCGEPVELEEGEAGICLHNRSVSGEEEAFEYHLKQMVITDPILYLKRFL